MDSLPVAVNSRTFAELCRYLLACDGVALENMGAVRIGRTYYPAVVYLQQLQTLEGSPAWIRGERNYTRRMVLLAGPLPAAIRHRRADAIMLGPFGVVWVAAYGGAVDRDNPHAVHRPRDPDTRHGMPTVLLSRDSHPGREDGKPLRIVQAEWEGESLSLTVGRILAGEYCPSDNDIPMVAAIVGERAAKRGCSAPLAQAAAEAYYREGIAARRRQIELARLN